MSSESSSDESELDSYSRSSMSRELSPGGGDSGGPTADAFSTKKSKTLKPGGGLGARGGASTTATRLSTSSST